MRFVTYCRVSTDRQGICGLGMAAQEELVQKHASAVHGDITMQFVEVETGRNNNRPELLKAIAYCKLTGAVLLIAKLDRLARNVFFISSLMESGVEFVVADMPTANRLTIHILAAVAEHEARIIGERIKAALAQAKKNGTKLGGYRARAEITEEKRELGLQKRQDAARLRASNILPMIKLIKSTGTTSLTGIASKLNQNGIQAPRGGAWTATQVMRLEKLVA